ncbi:hypothetical protein [Lactiplantibacillus plantarum]|jgi:hypothetical protein|uniref:hypothetical protein n=1 Tax=Lactiplantibacillus plantarum TaxID=1590 RepID=UPI001C1F6E95|nr:hypothetical protein [Lactiplantibacillus plantarum]MBU7472376.1 hypothetical protein [Lactiplantibacillus plantarum]MCK8451386.1 hypothetical protein [Lactiplantibacillus plantarum]
MDLDFKSNKYDLFDDWHQNKTKQAFTQKLQQQAQVEKTQLPQLLSREDLKIRWQMNSRQSVHQVASKPDFPQPVFAFNHGKTPLYLATEIQIFEINHPWVITPSARLAYSHWILRNVIDQS